MKDYKKYVVTFTLIADERLSGYEKKKKGLLEFIEKYNDFKDKNKSLFTGLYDNKLKKEHIQEIFWEEKKENDEESHYQYRLKVYFQNSKFISKRRLIKAISEIYESCNFPCAYYD